MKEIFVDNFAGGGGASTGIEMATGQSITVAINHDPDAILMHKTNHPNTLHLQASVWDVDPVEVCAGRPVALAWFSPDCKHFSKAKGSALVDRNIRGLAWIVLRWAAKVRPRVIMLENVEEFKTWGPVRKGKPIKSKVGETFEMWKRQLKDLGYVIDYRELVAADYGAPTTRKRFALIARCDGQPIVWPEPTHGSRDSEAVKAGRLLPWRSAAEIIDWSIPGYSIFADKREIKEKYGVNVQRPLKDNTLRRVIRGVDKFTIKSGKPFIVECNHTGDGHCWECTDPVNTITRKYTGGVCAPVVTSFIAQHKFSNPAQDIQEPLSTITAVGAHEAVDPVLVPFSFGNTTGSTGADVSQPVHTVTTAGNQILAAANLVQYHSEQGSETCRGQGLTSPVMTIDASPRYALASAHIQKYFDGAYKGCGDAADTPLSTITALPRHGVCAAHVVKFKGTNLGQSLAEPLQTATSKDAFAECCAILAKVTDSNMGHWPEIRVLLNKYCGYDLKEDEIILLLIYGTAYYIADITLRMLTPRELYDAMGFPNTYIIDRDYQGRSYQKSKQVARCGNAVCPPMAEAMVRANLPEYCTMKGEKAV